MPVHDFRFRPPQSLQPQKQVFQDHHPDIAPRPPKLPNYDKRVDIVESPQNTSPEQVIEVMTNGFHSLDEHMKMWLSGIKVPTLDSYKVASVHVAASDRSVLAWAQEFFDGRVPLPVISVHRTSWAFNPAMYSPPYHPISKQFTDRSRKRMRNIFRPMPFKVEYMISIWTEYKRDVEHIEADIVRRHNPMATFPMEDEHLRQIIHSYYNGTTNSSDIEIEAKQRPKVVYDVSLSVDYGIPLNEKIVPTVLGRVVSVKELTTGQTLETYKVEDIVS